MDRLKLVVVTAALAGCSGVPLEQGGKDEVQFASGEVIRIAWNPQLTTEAAVRSKAMAFCSGRSVDEVQASPGTGPSPTLQVKTWRCKAATGSGM
jgi:hypothetical protein